MKINISWMLGKIRSAASSPEQWVHFFCYTALGGIIAILAGYSIRVSRLIVLGEILSAPLVIAISLLFIAVCVNAAYTLLVGKLRIRKANRQTPQKKNSEAE
jgi:membrane-bound ClpP family serine protease